MTKATKFVLKWLKALGDENHRLKQNVADQALDIQELKENLTLKKLLKPKANRLAVSHIRESLRLSRRKSLSAGRHLFLSISLPAKAG